MKKFVLTLVLLNFCVFGQTQNWDWINPYPTGALINQTFFLNEQKGFAIGDAGTFLRTDDGGTTWEAVDPGIYLNLVKISFSDSLNGRVIGFNPISGIQAFLRTTDGGTTWVQYSVSSFGVYPLDMYFVNSQYGWYLGDQNKLFKTSDGGQTWLDKSLSSPDIFLRVRFRNENDGYLFGFSYANSSRFCIARTSNGGSSWDFDFGPYIGESCHPELVNDSTSMIVNSSGFILRSTDFCNSWTFKMNYPISQFNSVDFLDDNYGIIGSDSGNVLLTSDGGTSWNNINTGLEAGIYSIQYLNQNFICGNGYVPWSAGCSDIITSTDHGNTWMNHTRYIENRINISGIQPIDSITAFICGSMNYNDGYIYKTTNKGFSWQLVYFTPGNYLSDIKSLNHDVIFAAGGNYNQAVVLKSFDGGQTWSTITINSTSQFRALTLPDSSSMYAINESRIYKSTNMGSSWSNVYQPSSGNLIDIEFPSSVEGFCLDGNYSSQVYKTTDGGQSWTAYQITSWENSYKMSFPSASIGYVSTYNYIYKTTDGGITWNQSYPSTYNNRDIVFNDESNGWIITGYGIYRTTDGGQSWNSEFSQQYNDIFTVFGLMRGGELWAGGSYSYLIKYKGELPSPTSITSDIRVDIPREFALLQNYPNPFNPATKIRYDVPRETKVVLKIYDVLGAEVTTLINQNMKPGRYIAEWNAGNFASGVYIYRMDADGFSSSKKLMLLK